ncbi:hypothetical protein VP1G_09484 [Cytospora mali]|uniref:Uncharacterized protein n=1 Tax=Cytospora mali TaxID=578113 RepID=A0A194VEC3_CYTMA|nr:hypothetical protein VP1G_09484 [Valsa mali var. pyri (nom. inval.)]
MDLPIENSGLTEADLDRVFRYTPRPTTVVRFSAKDLEKVSVEDGSGLVLILARRAGEDAGIIQQIENGIASFGQKDTDKRFKNSFNEKSRSYSWPKGEKLAPVPEVKTRSPTPTQNIEITPRASRALRQVPFEKHLFLEISRHFFVNGSISRAINRADVPLFSRYPISMGNPTTEQGPCQNKKYDAIANTWPNDLALTATHFMQSRLTFGILFGCTEETEREAVNRISKAKEQSFHPLLLPGIFAELERERMVEVVESSIDQIEEAIFEMNIGASSIMESAKPSDDTSYPGGPRAARKAVWLNTTFLRNRLQTWKTQMLKMVEHVEEISAMIQSDANNDGSDANDEDVVNEDGSESSKVDPFEEEPSNSNPNTDLLRIGNLIKDRLRALIEEFEEMMEDCTMRVDGMAMATQWCLSSEDVSIRTVTHLHKTCHIVSLPNLKHRPTGVFEHIKHQTQGLGIAQAVDIGGDDDRSLESIVGISLQDEPVRKCLGPIILRDALPWPRAPAFPDGSCLLQVIVVSGRVDIKRRSIHECLHMTSLPRQRQNGPGSLNIGVVKVTPPTIRSVWAGGVKDDCWVDPVEERGEIFLLRDGCFDICRLFMGVSVARYVAVDDVDVLTAVRVKEEAGYEVIAQESATACYEDSAEYGE